MQASPAAINLIKHFEGFRLSPYKDTGGVWTVGYGHTRSAVIFGELGEDIDERLCDIFLRWDLKRSEKAVTELVKVPLTQAQFDALISFAFNVGPGNLQRSTLLKLLNERSYHGAAQEFEKWNKDDGKVLPGLTRRRHAERDMFLGKAWNWPQKKTPA